jgi:hypothetical protein
MDPRIQSLLAIAPIVSLIAVMVFGISIAVLGRRQWPWVARLATPGLVALAANVIGTVAVRYYTHHLSFAVYDDASVAAEHLAVLHLILFVLNWVGIALLTAAVFADRGIIHIGRLTIGSRNRGEQLR